MARNEETESHLLKGSLDPSTRLAHIALGDEVRPQIAISDVLPGLSGEAQQTMSVLGDNATLVIGANITGPWHYSSGRIDTFDKEGAATISGKFGRGTYLGVGELAGETVDGLRTGGAIKHDVSFTGNILALTRDQVSDVASNLRGLNGIPPSRLKSSIQNAPLTDYVETLSIDGQPVDAVMVYMDSEQTSAEIAVLPRSVENIRVGVVA